MGQYLITYDLRKERDYQPLFDALAALRAVKILDSLWCVSSLAASPAGLRDHFRQFIHADDGLFVASMDEWASWSVLRTPDQAV
jgi:hypothetical protein